MTHRTLVSPKPFLKWAGGKSQILGEIQRRYPAELGAGIVKYAEPFVGGGAVLFDVLSRYSFQEVYIGDINQALIWTYATIRDHATDLIDALKNIETQFLSANEDERKEIFYRKRKRFNLLKMSGVNSVELAALFIFLNKTCFNGLYRVNSTGEYNVPMGSFKKPKICDRNNLMAVSDILQGIIIACADYKHSLSFIDDNTFAYFDPPYRPLTATASFTSYSECEFGDKQQAELAWFIDEISKRGAYIIASNSDPKNIDDNDDFFDCLYARHKISRISAGRAINSVGASRGKIRELLICNA
jgi:DNA adenine methylase